MLPCRRSLTTMLISASALRPCPHRSQLLLALARYRGIHRQLDDAEWPRPSARRQQQWERHVIDRHPVPGRPLHCPVVGMAVEDRADLHAVDGILETARPEERIDLLRLAANGPRDGRVVEQRHAGSRP